MALGLSHAKKAKQMRVATRWLKCSRLCLSTLPALVGFAVACGSSSPRDGFANGDPDGGTNIDDGGPGFEGDAIQPDSSASGCSEPTKLVYVLSLEGDLYSFSPLGKKFTKVGPIKCDSGDDTFYPVSMAVDRQGVAWINMRPLIASEERLVKVDLKTAACTVTDIKGKLAGMAFTMNDGSEEKETLFAGYDKNKLATIDLVNGRINTVATLVDDSITGLELTGTGDGRLFGLLIQEPPDAGGPLLSLTDVNKATAAFSNPASLPGIVVPQAPMYAFSFWGGDFYFYTAPDTKDTTTTTVSRYRPSDKSFVPKYMESIGFHVVGAGVSTCAPLVPVK